MIPIEQQIQRLSLIEEMRSSEVCLIQSVPGPERCPSLMRNLPKARRIGSAIMGEDLGELLVDEIVGRLLNA